ncbi:MAG: acyl-CoA thioesterase [Candidatus Amulumruptor caecigallinarius]|nr:acyl-CoA thioesterase [Candidatus Amulumruptor caecigallinarius]MCM1397712.1 acyl-CoA thioesterase [Candidatus Amulumruptor caecigallinarius]MCM1454728.1 acyl-CoA thioesterase [bacterium]
MHTELQPVEIHGNHYIFGMEIKVRDYEVDSQGRVNNAIYLHYMEHTRHEFCEAAGLSFRSMSEQGIDPVVHRIDITYKAPLGLGATALSCLNIERQGARFIFRQAIYRMPAMLLCCTAEVTVVATRAGVLTRGEELAEAFARFL